MRRVLLTGYIYGFILGFITGGFLMLGVCLTFGNAFPEEMWPSWTGILNR